MKTTPIFYNALPPGAIAPLLAVLSLALRLRDGRDNAGPPRQFGAADIFGTHNGFDLRNYALDKIPNLATHQRSAPASLL